MVPPYLDMEAFTVDFTDAHGLWTLANSIRQLDENINDDGRRKPGTSAPGEGYVHSKRELADSKRLKADTKRLDADSQRVNVDTKRLDVDTKRPGVDTKRPARETGAVEVLPRPGVLQFNERPELLLRGNVS